MLGGSCNPCCDGDGWCLVFKSQGWTGWLADVGSSEINGDGSTFIASRSFPIEAQLEHEEPEGGFVTSRIRLVFYADELIVRATIDSSYYAPGGQIVLERTGAHGLLDGDVVELGQQDLVSNTFPADKDEYDKKPIESVGSLFFKLEKSPGSEPSQLPCAVGCAPNWFDKSQPLSTPETMTLTFTNKAARPAGPRWPQIGRPYFGGFGEYLLGRYAGFLSPNGVKEHATDGPVRTGCNSYMDRFDRPIVLRRVAGLWHTYLSDPINIKPCARVRYRFDACPSCITQYSCASQPRLSVSPFARQPNSFANHPAAEIFGDYPSANWDRAEYAATPSLWQSQKDAFVYTFGNFATVSPGGEYTPEPAVICGSETDAGWSLSEGCMGTKCPPDEVIVKIETGGQRPFLAGTYAVPVLLQECLLPYGSFIPDNFFGGTRAIYSGTFDLASHTLTIGVLRQETRAGPFGQFEVLDKCGCEGRPVFLTISYQPKPSNYYGTGTLNLPKADVEESCVSMCSASEAVLTFTNLVLQEYQLGGSEFPDIGTVTVTIPAAQ